jgi:hypothetical protein
MMTIHDILKLLPEEEFCGEKSTDKVVGKKGLNNNILFDPLPMLSCSDEDKPMAQAVKKNQIQLLVIMMFWHTKKMIWKITGYVVDLSTTDADVQTFH